MEIIRCLLLVYCLFVIVFSFADTESEIYSVYRCSSESSNLISNQKTANNLNHACIKRSKTLSKILLGCKLEELE